MVLNGSILLLCSLDLKRLYFCDPMWIPFIWKKRLACTYLHNHVLQTFAVVGPQSRNVSMCSQTNKQTKPLWLWEADGNNRNRNTVDRIKSCSNRRPSRVMSPFQVGNLWIPVLGGKIEERP